MDSQVNKRVGAAIRAARLAQGITQDDLAHVLNIERATISRYEQGTRPIPVAMITRLSHHLRTPVHLLLPDAFGVDAGVIHIVDRLYGYPELAKAVLLLLEHERPSERHLQSPLPHTSGTQERGVYDR